ncbi:hypothetical protein L4D15_13680 [Enterovibrio norvegicus]|uniref:hypothetical protein n=1 Tax=Enterovibrio norvegicus TaxID=188144 RepID=UPI003D14A9FB
MTVFKTIIDVAIFPVKRSPLSLISLFQPTVTHFVLAEGVACLDTQKAVFGVLVAVEKTNLCWILMS